ncbi:MAG: hypothetical protein ACF8XB_15035 [Planctomycetota bacterium JB042]
MRKTPAFVLFCLLASPSAAEAATWVVDASGSGDFPSIHGAIAVVSAGDVLLVKAGTYPPFTLTKDLSILGDPHALPTVTGVSLVSTHDARIAGLRFWLLDVASSNGVVVVDECETMGAGVGLDGCAWSMRIRNCAQVHVARSTIRGRDGDAFCEGPGLVVENSTVTVTRSELTGGDGWGDDFNGYAGRRALLVSGASNVILAACDLTGGNGGDPNIAISGQAGDGAPAARVSAPATLTARGNSGHEWIGGYGGFGGFPGQDALFAVEGTGTLVFSGVAATPAAFSPALTASFPSPPEPFVDLTNTDVPSGFVRVNLWGPAGNVQWLLASAVPARTTLFGVDGTLWLSPFQTLAVLPIPTKGQALSENLLFQLPPSLVGLESLLVTFQGFATGLGAGGAHLATNPAHVLIRR